MKGIILAGGKGVRLYPLTKTTNKHLLPVGKEPMIYNPIRQLISADIRDILIVTSRESLGDMMDLLGSGKEFDCDFTFKVQEEPRGIAHALLLGESFANGESVTVILGDNIASHSIKAYVEKFKNQKKGAKLLLKEVRNPYSYGIAEIYEDKIISIEEKPDIARSNYAVIGIYIYNNDVFNIIKNISPSKRGEFEITSVNNIYIEREDIIFDIIKGDWKDAGTFETYREANEILSRIDNKIISGDILWKYLLTKYI